MHPPPPFPADFSHMLSLQTLREALSVAAGTAAALGIIIAVRATSAMFRLSKRSPAKHKPRSRVVNGTAAQVETPGLRRRAVVIIVVGGGGGVRSGALVKCVSCVGLMHS